MHRRIGRRAGSDCRQFADQELIVTFRMRTVDYEFGKGHRKYSICDRDLASSVTAWQKLVKSPTGRHSASSTSYFCMKKAPARRQAKRTQ